MRPARTRRALATTLGIAVLASALGCQSGGNDAARDGVGAADAASSTRTVVRVGYANEAPFAYVDPSTGRVTGEAPEIARVIMGRLGADEMDGVLTEFGSLIPGLKAGRFDLIAAGMYITAERCKQVAFTEPSYSLGGSFLVAKGNPLDLHGYEDVKANPDARLGVMAGAVETGYARAVGIPDSQLMQFPDPPSALAAVAAGRVDAFAGTALTVADLLSKVQSDAVERARPFHDPVIDGESVRGYGAFVFRPDDLEKRDAFDRELAAFLGTPEHRALVEPFGFTESELPGDVTREQLCASEPG